MSAVASPFIHHTPEDKEWQLFLVQFAPSGQLKWIHTWTGDQLHSITDLQIDRWSNAYLVGNHLGALSLDPPPKRGTKYCFRFYRLHTRLCRATRFYGTIPLGQSFPSSYKVDAQLLRLDATHRFAYLVTRWTTPLTSREHYRHSWSGQYDNGHLLSDSICLYKLHTVTGRTVWRRNFSGPNNIIVKDMDVYEDTHLYWVGTMLLPNNNNRDPSFGSFPLYYQGVVVQLDRAGQQQWVHRYPYTDIVHLQAIHIGPEGEAYVLGSYDKKLTISLSTHESTELYSSPYEFFTQRCYEHFIHFLDRNGTFTGALNLCNIGESTAQHLLDLSQQWHSHPDLRTVHPLLHPLDTTTWVILYKDDGVYHSSYRLPAGRNIVDFVPVAVASFDEETFEECPNGLFSNKNYQVEIVENKRSRHLPYYSRFRRRE